MKAVMTMAIFLFLTGSAVAQDWSSAGSNWTGSYNFPSSNDRQVRLNTADVIKKLESGFYEDYTADTTMNTYNYTTYDSRVGDITVNAAEGSAVEVTPRTGQNSGTSTYTVGAVNTTTNTVTIDGSGNQLDISSNAHSTGCQNGSVSVSRSYTTGGFDISTGSTASVSSGAGTGVGTCN